MEPLFVLLPAIIYWCIDEKKGLGLSVAVLLSMWIVFFLEYQDVRLPFGFAANLLITAVIICVYIFLVKRIEALFAKGGFRTGMIATAAVSFLMIMRLPCEKLLIPGGILLGLGTGFGLNCRYIGFKSKLILERTSTAMRYSIAKYLVLFVRFLLGVTGFLLILAAAGKIIPQDSGNVNLYNFIRYALSGLWISAAVPWIFIRLRLAGKTLPARQEPASEYFNKEKDE